MTIHHSTAPPPWHPHHNSNTFAAQTESLHSISPSTISAPGSYPPQHPIDILPVTLVGHTQSPTSLEVTPTTNTRSLHTPHQDISYINCIFVANSASPSAHDSGGPAPCLWPTPSPEKTLRSTLPSSTHTTAIIGTRITCHLHPLLLPYSASPHRTP